jgi:ABC 3 transport family.
MPLTSSATCSATSSSFPPGISSLWGGLLLLIALSVLLWYNEFQAITFDEEYATIQNLPVVLLHLYLLSLIALTVVMLIRVSG